MWLFQRLSFQTSPAASTEALPSSRFTFVERGQASSGMEALCQALSAARSKSPLLGVGP